MNKSFLMYKALLIIIFLFKGVNSYSQKRYEDFAQKYTGMGALSEIIMSNKCIIRENFNLFFESTIKKEEAERTFIWYKLVFHQPCHLSFTIIPNNEKDRYGMEVYKVKNNIKVCNETFNNVFVKEDSLSKDINYTDNFQTDSFRNSLFHTRQIEVDLNEAVYILVHNKMGPDLGHVIDLQTCDYSYVLKVNKEKIESEEKINRNLLAGDGLRLQSIVNKICQTEPDKKLGYSNFLGEKMGVKNFTANQVDSASKEQAKAVRILDSLAGKKLAEIMEEDPGIKINLKEDTVKSKDNSGLDSKTTDSLPKINSNPIVLDSLPKVENNPNKIIPDIYQPQFTRDEKEAKISSFTLVDSLVRSIHQAEESFPIDKKKKKKKTDKSFNKIDRVFFVAFESGSGKIIEQTELKLNKKIPTIYRDSIKAHEVMYLNTNKLQIKFSKMGYMPYDKIFTSEHCKYSGSDLYYIIEMNPLKEGDKLALSNVLFQPNTTVLRNSSKKELDKLADYMRSHLVKIRINGHTQGNRRIKNTGKGVGKEQRFKGSAWKLSRKRAKKVMEYLVSKGIEKNRLSTRGYAGLKPIHKKPKNLSEREENMRVEIEVIEFIKLKKDK